MTQRYNFFVNTTHFFNEFTKKIVKKSSPAYASHYRQLRKIISISCWLRGTKPGRTSP